MTSRAKLQALFGAVIGLAALPGAAQAQRCAVAEIEVPALQIRVGERGQLLVIFRDRSGIPCDVDPTFTAVSSNSGVARIERSAGVMYVTGVSAGAAAITVRTGTGRTAHSGAGSVVVSAEAPAVVNGTPGVAPPVVTPTLPIVNPDPGTPGRTTPGSPTLRYQQPGTGAAAGIVPTPQRLQMLPGEARFLGYRTADVTGGPAEPLPLQFQVEPSAALSFVSIDSIGVVTAGDTGTATIRIVAVGRPTVRQAIVPVEVRADSVRFARSQINLAPGMTDTMRLRVVDQNREIALGQVYQFASNDTTVARVHLFQPVIEARAPGEATVTATNPRLPPVQLTVRVFRPVTAIQLPDSQLTIAIRQVRRVTMRPVVDTTYIPEAPRTIRGLDTTRVRAAWDSTTGTYTFTGLASGETSLTMRVQNGRDSASAVERTLRIRVVAGGLSLSRTRVGMPPNERAPVQMALLDDRRQPLTGVTPEVAWTSSDTNVARFEGGNVVSRNIGRARLTGRTPWDSVATIDVFVVGEMLVVKQRAGAWNVFSRTAAGQWTALTSDSLVELFPTWSPDVTRIAYAVRPAGRSRGGDLFVANSDGSEAHRVFGVDSASVMRPQFVGPAGEQLVFELNYPSDGRSEVWMVGLDGGNARKLQLGVPGAFIGFPSVSPDGQRILYVSLRPGPGLYDVYMSNIDASGERRLTTWGRADDAPAWAPDGESFFFLRDEGEVSRRPSKRVYRFDLRGDSAAAVSPPGSFISAFGVSGDGRTLVLNVLDPSNATTSLSTMPIPGTALTPLTMDVGEILAPASPTAMRPAPRPAAAAPSSGSGSRP